MIQAVGCHATSVAFGVPPHGTRGLAASQDDASLFYREYVMSTDRGIECELRFAKRLSGKPLREEDKQRLRDYDAEPTLETWNDVAWICVYGPLSMSAQSAWAATSRRGAMVAQVQVPVVHGVHGGYASVQTRFLDFPTREEFRRALFFATH